MRLPTGWQSARLGDLGVEVRESVRPDPDRMYELYSVPAFASGKAEILQGSEIGSSKRRVAAGDLLLCKINPRINRVWSVAEPVGGEEQLASNEYLVLRLHDRDPVLRKYLVWYLRSPAFRDWIKLNVEGATGSHTRAKSGPILDQYVPLAPPELRLGIVEEVEKQFTRLDASVSALRTSRKSLRAYRASVLEAAASGRLGPAARPSSGVDRWRWVSLEEVTVPTRPICYGILMPRTKTDASVPYLEVKDLQKWKVDPESLHKTSFQLHEQYQRSAITAGDIVLSIRGSWDTGAILPPALREGNISRDVARIAVRQGVDSRYVLYFLLSPIAQRYFNHVARGVAVRGVNIRDLKATPVDLPPPEEQAVIATEVERRLSLVEELDREIQANQIRAHGLRQAILSRAFSGDL